MEKKLEAMMTSKESFWPDEQILTQSVCEGQEGPFAKHGKALSSVFVQVFVELLCCSPFLIIIPRWVINTELEQPQR